PVEAAARPAVLVHEDDGCAFPALLAVDARSVGALDVPHSTLNPEVFTTCAHLAISLSMNPANSCGESDTGSRPCVAIASRSSADATAWRTSALRRVTISADVPFGAMRPNQAVTSRPGSPASAAVGTEGSCARRAGPSTASARSLPDWMFCCWNEAMM